MRFRTLESIDQLSEIDKESSHSEVLIFKHSTRCPVSSMVYNRFERKWDVPEEEVPVYYLDLIRYRDISDRIAEHYDTRHESPQILLIRNGKCEYHRSHHAIEPDEIIDELKNA